MSFYSLLISNANIYKCTYDTVDTYGGNIKTRSLWKSNIKCRIRLLSGYERIKYEREGVESSHRVYFKLEIAGITELDEVVIGNQVYKVTFVNFVDKMSAGIPCHYEVDVEIKDSEVIFDTSSSSSDTSESHSSDSESSESVGNVSTSSSSSSYIINWSSSSESSSSSSYINNWSSSSESSESVGNVSTSSSESSGPVTTTTTTLMPFGSFRKPKLYPMIDIDKTWATTGTSSNLKDSYINCKGKRVEKTEELKQIDDKNECPKPLSTCPPCNSKLKRNKK